MYFLITIYSAILSPKYIEIPGNEVFYMTYYEKLAALGLNIAYYRKLRFLTQEQFAEKANISISTVRKIENPNLFTGITFEKICRIADALGVTESALLDFRNPNGST